MRAINSVGDMSWLALDWWCRRTVLRMTQGVQAAATEVTRTQRIRGVAGVVEAIQGVQGLFISEAHRHLPSGVGWLGVEGRLRRPSTFRGYSVVVTVDLEEGMPTLIQAAQNRRRLLPGEVAVKLGVLANGWPIASYICDASNLITYTRRPYSRVVRISPSSHGSAMDALPMAGRAGSLGRGVLLRQGTELVQNPLMRRLMGTAFGEVQQGNGSLSLAVARILTGEFVAVLQPAGGSITPWGQTPIAAICGQGVVVALRVGTRHLYRVAIGPLAEKVARRKSDVLYVGGLYMDELRGHVRVV